MTMLPETPDRSDNALSESDLLNVIEQIVRMTKKAYGYQHLSTIGSYLRTHYPDFSPANYGCKSLLQLIERYPERFKVKWSAPAHKGHSHIWVRLATEPKRKEGYTDTNPTPPSVKPKPRLMTGKEFERLCQSLGEAGVVDRCDGSLRKTRQWLRRRDFLSLEANSKLIRELGGHCDCEVLFNVAGSWPYD
ncbi:MAG: DUF2695 domain-containing protein [Chloroflexota bacterium]|nr:DUF2695 domain-containing protein [Chloroflexota bacterium]